MISIYTGQRKSNILSMNWNDINLKSKTWHIPETKNGEVLTMPLVNDAYELLKELNKNKENNEWVFPSKKSKSGHLEKPKRAWSNLLKQAGIENLRIHDIRRTLGSYQAISGSSLHIIGKSLGHKTSKATMVYTRLNEEPVRASMENAIEMIKNIEKDQTTK